MDRIVAVRDIGTAELTEANLKLDLAARPQSPHVFAGITLLGRDIGSSAVHSDTFLEVEVDRVIPT